MRPTKDTTHGPELDTTHVVEHARFLRALARGLVRDEATADDVAQDAWMDAVAHPPALDRPLAGWLETVTRRVASRRARAARRRADREAHVARPEVTRPAVDGRLVRELSDAVLGLPEPYRAAILARFYEGLPPRRIAARLGVPVETVRTRIKRALALLRESLDDCYGDRTSWCVAASALGAAAGRGRIGLGALTTLIGAVASIIGALLFWGLGSLAQIPDDGVPIVLAPVPHERSPERASPSSTQATRRPGPDVPATAATPTERRGPEPRGLHGRVVTDGRHPVARAHVHLVSPDRGTRTTIADAAGRFAFDQAETAGAWAGAALHAVAPGGDRAALELVVVDAFDGVADLIATSSPPAQLMLRGREPGERVRVAVYRGELFAAVLDAEVDLVALPRLPEGVYTVIAADPARRTGSCRLEIPSVATPDLQLAPGGRLGLQVTSDGKSGVGGASLDVRRESWSSGLSRSCIPLRPLLGMATVDVDGSAVIDGLPADEALEVWATSPRHPPQLVHVIAADDALSTAPIRVRLRGFQSWDAVIDPSTHVPPEGPLEVLTTSWVGPPRLVAQVLYAHVKLQETPTRGEATLRAASGEQCHIAWDHEAPWQGPPDRRAVQFVESRSLTISATDRDGRPLTELAVEVRADDERIAPLVRLDDTGAGRVEAFHDGEVSVIGHGRLGAPVFLGRAKVARGGAELVFRGPRPVQTLTIDVLVDGRPALPTRYQLEVTGGTVLATREEPERGRLTITYLRHEEETGLAVDVVAPGSGRAGLVAPPQPVASRLAVHLSRTSTLEVKLVAAADDPLFFDLQRYDDDLRRWESRPPVDFTQQDAGRVVRIEDLPPGWYRLVDEISGRTSAVVAVDPGETSRVTFVVGS